MPMYNISAHTYFRSMRMYTCSLRCISFFKASFNFVPFIALGVRLYMVCINIVNSALMYARDVHLNTYIHTYVNTHLHIPYLKEACTLLQNYSVFDYFLRGHVLLCVTVVASLVGRCKNTSTFGLCSHTARFSYH